MTNIANEVIAAEKRGAKNNALEIAAILVENYSSSYLTILNDIAREIRKLKEE